MSEPGIQTHGKQRIAPHITAAWLYFMAAGLVVAIWYIYLFVATPENLSIWESAAGQLRYSFSDSHLAWWFAWMISLPALCLLLGLAYLLNLSRTRTIGVVLFAISIALAMTTLVLNDLGLAVFVAIPSLWGYRAIGASG